MTGKSPLTASEAQRAALMVLAGSRDRGEADRARGVLLTLAGWTSARIAEAFGVREDTVRLWRSDFMSGGVEALKATVAPGPVPVKSEAALRVALPLLGDLSPTGATGHPPLRAEIETREACASAAPNYPRPCAKKVPLAAAAAHAEGRQVAAEVERVGLRLHLRQQQAVAGDIVLLYGDESEALTHPYLALVSTKAEADLRVPAPGHAKKVACWVRSITSRVGSSCIPARPSAAATSSPISNNWINSMVPSPASLPSRGTRSGQWSHPHQQTLARSACIPRSLAHRPVAAQICTGAKRHRRRLARPQGASSRPSDLRRRRRTQYRNPSAVDALNLERTPLPLVKLQYRLDV